MLSWLTAAARLIGVRGLKVMAIAVAVIAILLRVRDAGRIIERAETAEHAARIRYDQLRASTRRPRNRDQLVDRMRDGAF